MKALRWYQREAVDAVLPPEGRKLIVIPTGGGKALICAELCLNEVLLGRVLVLVPGKELAVQNEAELRALAPDLDIGVFCSGLKRWDFQASVVIATVQSIYKKLHLFADVTLIIIDECHKITPVGGKMYRAVLETFDKTRKAELNNEDARFPVIGLTATPFRTGTGYLHKGTHAIFDHVIRTDAEGKPEAQPHYEVSYQQLVDEGYLVPFAKMGSELAYSDEGLHMQAGDFKQTELDELAKDNAKTAAIVKQVTERAADRWAIMFFALNVRHAYVAQREFAKHGWSASVVHGDLDDKERDELTADFLSGLYRVEISVGIRTTGFNYPAMDCIVMCRVIGSPVLFIQIGGRGTRLYPGKVDCLLLDYGGNIGRFGSFDKPEIREKGTSKDSKTCKKCGEKNSTQARKCHACDAPFPEMFKGCPECGETVDRSSQHCKTCGYYWPINEDGLDEDGKTIIENKEIWVDLKSTTYRKHTPRRTGALDDRPDCFVAMHKTVDGATVQEYVFPESFAARPAFIKWWRMHNGKEPAPKTAEEAKNRRKELIAPSSIRVIRKGKFFNFTARKFP